MKNLFGYMTALAIVSMALIATGCGKAPASTGTFTLHTSTSAN